MGSRWAAVGLSINGLGLGMTHSGEWLGYSFCQLDKQQRDQAEGQRHSDILAVQRPEVEQFPRAERQ